MNDKNIKYEKQKKLWNIISEASLIIGAVLVYRTPSNIVMSIIGLVFAVISMLCIFKYFRLIKKIEGKRYKVIGEKIDSLKGVAKEQGVGMGLVAFATIVAILTNIFGIVLIYFLTHSWLKTVLTCLAFELVLNIREYFNIEQKN